MSLPPLPEPRRTTPVEFGCDGQWWDAEQMREYAAACVAGEREACAKVCEGIEARQNDGYDGDYEDGIEAGADRCADAIRARGDA